MREVMEQIEKQFHNLPHKHRCIVFLLELEYTIGGNAKVENIHPGKAMFRAT
jgi:hypothetical protein